MYLKIQRSPLTEIRSRDGVLLVQMIRSSSVLPMKVILVTKVSVKYILFCLTFKAPLVATSTLSYHTSWCFYMYSVTMNWFSLVRNGESTVAEAFRYCFRTVGTQAHIFVACWIRVIDASALNFDGAIIRLERSVVIKVAWSMINRGATEDSNDEKRTTKNLLRSLQYKVHTRFATGPGRDGSHNRQKCGYAARSREKPFPLGHSAIVSSWVLSGVRHFGNVPCMYVIVYGYHVAPQPHPLRSLVFCTKNIASFLSSKKKNIQVLIIWIYQQNDCLNAETKYTSLTEPVPIAQGGSCVRRRIQYFGIEEADWVHAAPVIDNQRPEHRGFTRQVTL